jgi:hypothetical protein
MADLPQILLSVGVWLVWIGAGSMSRPLTTGLSAFTDPRSVEPHVTPASGVPR